MTLVSSLGFAWYLSGFRQKTDDNSVACCNRSKYQLPRSSAGSTCNRDQWKPLGRTAGSLRQNHRQVYAPRQTPWSEVASGRCLAPRRPGSIPFLTHANERHPYLIQMLINHQGKVLPPLGGSALEPLKKDTTWLIGRTMSMLCRGVVADPGLSAQKELRILQKNLGWYI